MLKANGSKDLKIKKFCTEKAQFLVKRKSGRIEWGLQGKCGFFFPSGCPLNCNFDSCMGKMPILLAYITIPLVPFGCFL
jgi:hypothetical protein